VSLTWLKRVMVSYQVKQKLNLRTPHSRTAGVHLSGILRPLAFSMGFLDKKWDTGETIEELIERTPEDQLGLDGNLMRITLGCSIEDWIAKQLTAMRPGFIHQPGEYVLDDIICTPDGVECDGEGWLVHEIKGTFKSARKSVQEQKLWIWQGACYLRVLSEYFHEHITRCMFHPFYIRGDYTGIDPLYLPTLVIFEWEEILSYWNTVVQNRGMAVPEKGQG
jgi:hypothetical protein